MLKATIITNILLVNVGAFEKFIKCWNGQIEARQVILSAKLTAVALDIAGPIYVEQTQTTKEVLNDFATRTDDLDDFLPVVATQASNTPRIGSLQVKASGDRPKPTGTQLEAGDRPSTGTKRPNPDTAAYDAGPKRHKTKVCLLNVSTL